MSLFNTFAGFLLRSVRFGFHIHNAEVIEESQVLEDEVSFFFPQMVNLVGDVDVVLPEAPVAFLLASLIE